MKIREILAKHYEHFLGLCTKKDTALIGGKTSEDILGESVITAINKFGDEDISEEEGYRYFEKVFLEACLFSYKKKGSGKERMIEYVADYGEI